MISTDKITADGDLHAIKKIFKDGKLTMTLDVRLKPITALEYEKQFKEAMAKMKAAKSKAPASMAKPMR